MARKRMLTIRGIVNGKEVDIYRYDFKTPTQEGTISVNKNLSLKQARIEAQKQYGITIRKIKRRVYYL